MPPPLRILLVEDDDAYSGLVAAQLSTAGFSVDVTRVRSLAEASRRLREQSVDVILLDLNLPDGTGLQSLARMQELAPEIPIVVLTGRDNDAERRRPHEERCDADRHPTISKGSVSPPAR